MVSNFTVRTVRGCKKLKGEKLREKNIVLNAVCYTVCHVFHVVAK